MTDTKHTAAQPLDLDKHLADFEAMFAKIHELGSFNAARLFERVSDGRRYCSMEVEYAWQTYRALIAQARAARPSIQVNLLNWALRELLGALPERRDWLNPEVESILRAVLDGTYSVVHAAQDGALINEGTTASVSIDEQINAVMSVPDDKLDDHLRDMGLDPAECEAAGRRALDAALNSIAAQPVQTGVAVDELRERVLEAWANYERMGEVCSFEGNSMIYASTLEELAEIARATLAPVAAQQAAAKAPAAQTVDARTGPVQIVREAVRQLAESPRRAGSSYVEGMVVGANMCLVRLERALAASPASTPEAAPSKLQVEARHLAGILRGLCEGGGEERDADIYADDYQPGDGDVFVIRAADLLDEFAAAPTAGAATTSEDTRDAALRSGENALTLLAEKVRAEGLGFAFADELVHADAARAAMRATQQEGGNE